MHGKLWFLICVLFVACESEDGGEPPNLDLCGCLEIQAKALARIDSGESPEDVYKSIDPEIDAHCQDLMKSATVKEVDACSILDPRDELADLCDCVDLGNQMQSMVAQGATEEDVTAELGEETIKGCQEMMMTANPDDIEACGGWNDYVNVPEDSAEFQTCEDFIAAYEGLVEEFLAAKEVLVADPLNEEAINAYTKSHEAAFDAVGKVPMSCMEDQAATTRIKELSDRVIKEMSDLGSPEEVPQ